MIITIESLHKYGAIILRKMFSPIIGGNMIFDNINYGVMCATSARKDGDVCMAKSKDKPKKGKRKGSKKSCK